MSSLVDTKDVLLRNFGRPVQAVALSPEYKSDRSYLSGGLAGDLVLTAGGRSGTTSTSTTTGGAAAAASGWLGTIGLGAHNGTDTVLHSGEGSIGAIKWSLSGRFVVWVNEHGIKIVRSSLYLEAAENESAWKGISHIDRPSLPGWEEMAGLWKARAEWINEDGLEADDDDWSSDSTRQEVKAETASIASIDLRSLRGAPKVKPVEKLIVGWGGTIWIINVHPGGRGAGKDVGEGRKWHVEVVTMYDFTREYHPGKLADGGTVCELIALYQEFRFIPPVCSLFLPMLRPMKVGKTRTIPVNKVRRKREFIDDRTHCSLR